MKNKIDEGLINVLNELLLLLSLFEDLLFIDLEII